MSGLVLDGVQVAQYNDGTALPIHHSPRPFLHPVRTLTGHVVTDLAPTDHPWHAGISHCFAHVEGRNFWGGPTFDGQAYQWRSDHGRIHGQASQTNEEIQETLGWQAKEDILLTERRTLHAERVDARSWTLHVGSTLTARVPLRIGSPATEGRAMAGYGGLFWRAAPRFLGGTVSTDNGTSTETVRYIDESAECVVEFRQFDALEPWFIRTEEYPGLGAAPVFARPFTLAAGEKFARRYAITFTDR